MQLVGDDPDYDIITNDKYINIFNEIKKIYNLNNTDIKPYLMGEINNEPEKLTKIKEIFGEASTSLICTDTIISLKNIIISPDIIIAIGNLSNEKKGRFSNMTSEDIYEQLSSEGYHIEDDGTGTGPLDRMDFILSDRPLDDISHPIHVKKLNNKYTIDNGRHRVSRALIENRQSICVKIISK